MPRFYLTTAIAYVNDAPHIGHAYEVVASASDPQATLLRFVESAHAAAADLAGWDRAHLECASPQGPDWWRNRP